MGREEGEGERRGKGRRGKGRAPMTRWHGAPQCLNPALSKTTEPTSRYTTKSVTLGYLPSKL